MTALAGQWTHKALQVFMAAPAGMMDVKKQYLAPDSTPVEHILHLLLRYKYFLLFPLSVVEGPIITVIAGFLCSNGWLRLLTVYPVIIAGDLVGDSMYYCLGRYGRSGFLRRFGNKLGLTETRFGRVKDYVGANPYKIISLSKIVLGVGVAGLFLAGRARIPYRRFLVICLLTSLVQCAAYLCLGWFFGKAYQLIDQYLGYLSSIILTLVLAIACFLVLKNKLVRK